MLIPQQTRRDSCDEQGRSRVSLAELRAELANPSRISDGVRQRLLELAGRLAEVRGLGDEHARIDLSEYAASALRGSAEVA